MTARLVDFDAIPWDWVDRHCSGNIYQTSEFLRAWLQCLGGGALPRTLLFFGEEDTLNCVAPLLLLRERHLWTTLRILKPVGWDFLWPSVCVPFSLEHLECLRDELLARRSDWDVFEFALVSEDTEPVPPVRDVFAQAGFLTHASSRQGYPYISIEGSWEAYYRSKSRNLRKNISWLLGKAERAGVRYSFADGSAACAYLDTFFALHVRRWSARGHTSAYTTDAYREFMRTMCTGLAATREFNVQSLVIDGKTIAAAACFTSQGVLHFHHTTFDIEYATLSPGKLLLYFIVKDAFRRGLREINLGLSRDEYKYWWGTGGRTLSRFVVLSRRQPALWLEHMLRSVKKATGLRLSRTRGLAD